MRKNGKNLRCVVCNKEFYRCISAIKQGGGKFCSLSCKSQYLWSDLDFRKRQIESHRGKMPSNIEQLIAYTKSDEGRKNNTKGQLEEFLLISQNG